MKCSGPCVYSRQINQPYPRLCVHCKTLETVSDAQTQEASGLDSSMNSVRYWKEKVETARQIMSAAIHGFDQARSGLSQAESELMSLVMNKVEKRERKFWTCASCLGIYLDTQDCTNCMNPTELKIAKSP